jgi:hypothetical protein
MKKVIIKNLMGEETNTIVMEDPSEVLANLVDTNYFGLPGEYTVEIIDITSEYALAEVIKNRVAEYPSPAEFMNAFFDGGESAIAELQAKRLAIKAKYPKPV